MPNLRLLLLVAVVLPAVICALDYAALSFAYGNDWPAQHALLTYGLFVGQVALVSWAAGRLLQNWYWRLGMFAWVMTLINLQLYSLQGIKLGWSEADPAALLGFALLSAQLSALAMWCVLGRGYWAWRIPATCVAGVLLTSIMPNMYGIDVWKVLLCVQVCGLLVLLFALRAARYRLQSQSEIESLALAQRVRQFSIAHMMIWTAAIAILLTLFRGVQPWLTVVGSVVWLRMGVLGLCCAVVALVSVWSTLGEGAWFLRVPLLIGLPPMVGALVRWMTAAWTQVFGAGGAWSSFRYHFDRLKDLDWHWLAWTSLAGWFLAAVLMLLRSTGYRLVRVKRHA
jgi:hypothetical protein